MNFAFVKTNPSEGLLRELYQAGHSVTEIKRADVWVLTGQSLSDFKPFYHQKSGDPSVVVVIASDLLVSQSDFIRFIQTRQIATMVLSQSTWESQFICNLPIWSQINDSHTVKIQLETLHKKTQEIVEKFQNDLSLASDIQKRLLADSSTGLPGIKVTSKYIPAAGLGGDYFDVFELPEKKQLGILIADSKTHGMAAALLSVLLKMRIQDFKSGEAEPQLIVEHLNRELYNIHQSRLPGLDLFFGVLDRTSLRFAYISAGSLQPLLWRNRNLVPVPVRNFPQLGVDPGHTYLSHSLQLLPGDLLFCHTNGLETPLCYLKETDVQKELTRLFQSEHELNPIQFQNEIVAQIDYFKSSQTEIPDDITFVQLFIEPNALYLTQSR